MAIIGPISGEISIAPIITAVAFIFKPTEAIIMAHINIMKLAPPILTPSNIFSWISSYVAWSFLNSLKNLSLVILTLIPLFL